MNYKIMMLLLIISASTAATLNSVYAQQTHDITKSADGQATGGEKMGTLTVTPTEHTVDIVVVLGPTVSADYQS